MLEKEADFAVVLQAINCELNREVNASVVHRKVYIFTVHDLPNTDNKILQMKALECAKVA